MSGGRAEMGASSCEIKGTSGPTVSWLGLQFQRLRATDKTQYHVAVIRDRVPRDRQVPPCLVERVGSVPSVPSHPALLLPETRQDLRSGH